MARGGAPVVVATDLPHPGSGATPSLSALSASSAPSALPPADDVLRLSVDVGRRFALSVHGFGLACCAVEFVAAAYGDHLAAAGPSAADPPAVGSPELAAVDVLVVSGTLTDKMAPAVRRFYERMPEPRYVVSFGACASCGGPYWDSYSVTKGVDQLIPVDVYVPGCPPRPEALVHGLRVLDEQITAAEQRAGAPA